MRIEVIQKPPIASVDGLRLDRFEPGHSYDVGTALGILMLAEHWAEPVINEAPSFLVPLTETRPSDDHEASNQVRDKFPPYAGQSTVAANRDPGNRFR